MGGVARRAAFIDRDGTINERPGPHEYLTSADAFRWVTGAAQGLTRLAEAGFLLAVVSNQRGVARGLVAPEVLTAIEEHIQRDLAARGCRIEAFRYCLHDTDQGCLCRKPKPGMLLDLADEFSLDLPNSWMIGDDASDVLAGRAAGCRTVLLDPERDGDGCGRGGDREDRPRADLVATSLEHASELIVGQPSRLAR